MRSDASSATASRSAVSTGLFRSGGSPPVECDGLSSAGIAAPLLGFVPLRRLRTARVHRHRCCHTPAVVPSPPSRVVDPRAGASMQDVSLADMPFLRPRRLAPRPVAPGFAPGNVHGVSSWVFRGFPPTWPDRASPRRRPSWRSRCLLHAVRPVPSDARCGRSVARLRAPPGFLSRSDPLPPALHPAEPRRLSPRAIPPHDRRGSIPS
jgi:hypothetical protein